MEDFIFSYYANKICLAFQEKNRGHVYLVLVTKTSRFLKHYQSSTLSIFCNCIALTFLIMSYQSRSYHTEKKVSEVGFVTKAYAAMC